MSKPITSQPSAKNPSVHPPKPQNKSMQSGLLPIGLLLSGAGGLDSVVNHRSIITSRGTVQPVRRAADVPPLDRAPNSFPHRIAVVRDYLRFSVLPSLRPFAVRWARLGRGGMEVERPCVCAVAFRLCLREHDGWLAAVTRSRAANPPCHNVVRLFSRVC